MYSYFVSLSFFLFQLSLVLCLRMVRVFCLLVFGNVTSAFSSLSPTPFIVLFFLYPLVSSFPYSLHLCIFHFLSPNSFNSLLAQLLYTFLPSVHHLLPFPVTLPRFLSLLRFSRFPSPHYLPSSVPAGEWGHEGRPTLSHHDPSINSFTRGSLLASSPQLSRALPSRDPVKGRNILKHFCPHIYYFQETLVEVALFFKGVCMIVQAD